MHRLDHDAHMALCATYQARQAHAANVSRVLTRHASQRAHKRASGFAPVAALALASIIGCLLAL